MQQYATAEEWAAFKAKHPTIEYLDVILLDLCANPVGKRLPIGQVGKLLEQGAPNCAAMVLVDVIGNTADPMGHGVSDGDPDGVARPIAGSFAPIPWSSPAGEPPKGAQVLCEMCAPETGLPYWYEPRHLLAQIAARFEPLGLKPVLALELEFYLLGKGRDTQGGPVPIDSPRTGLPEGQGRVLSLAKLDEYQPILDTLEATCKAQNIPVTTMISEYGAGQFEINLAHGDDILLAADHAALLKRAVISAARASGYEATFMSKPFGDDSGSGLHLHISLVDEDGNIFDPARSDGEQRLNHAVGGLQATMFEAMAIFAPNLNAYRRFEPDNFTPVTTDWAENNRSAAIRLPWSADGSGRRLEHRVAGADANPYLVTAAILAGIHYGLSNQIVASEKATGNTGTEMDENMPATMWDALAAFKAARILPDYFGAAYIEMYHTVKSAELSAFFEEISTREYDWYL